jgi:hypothetical protein
MAHRNLVNGSRGLGDWVNRSPKGLVWHCMEARTGAAALGVNYGTVADDLPSALRSVK